MFVFEVIDRFGGDTIDPGDKLFDFGYGSTPGFPLPPEASLRMILTNSAAPDGGRAGRHLSEGDRPEARRRLALHRGRALPAGRAGVGAR